MPSLSKSQQRLFGQAYAYKVGRLKSRDLNPDYRDQIKKIAKSMSLKSLKKYASTKHDSLPERVSERRILSFESFIKYMIS
jgi:hypothetical protein